MIKNAFESIPIPPLLKDFSVWLNPKTTKVISLKDTISVSKELFSNKVDKVPKDIQVELSNGLEDSKKSLGLFALRIYFYQIYRFSSFSLDLRKTRFNLADHWTFRGEILAGSFPDGFISSLRTTYDGFFDGSDKKLREGLNGMGLMDKNWTTSDRDELTELFKGHFRSNGQVKRNFKLSDMIHSFTNIFEYLRNKNSKIDRNFLMLGVYLTSLYITLDPIAEELDVEECYKFSKKLAKKSVE